MSRPGTPQPLTADERVGVALYFDVKVDGRPLGWFTGVKGLIAEHEVYEWAQGGENSFVHRLPGRLKYRDITLSRCTDPGTAELASWVEQVRSDRRVHTGAITAYDAAGAALVVYSLRDVWPIRYSGPVLDTVTGGLARETLDLAHSGFTVTAAAAS